jgi:hypothetical protein
MFTIETPKQVINELYRLRQEKQLLPSYVWIIEETRNNPLFNDFFYQQLKAFYFG